MEKQTITDIPTNQIFPNDYNPNVMDSETKWFLTRDIKENGFVEPILVRKVEEERYEIIDGEQRWEVAKELGLTSIPAIVREMSELDRKTATINLDYIHGDENVFKTGKAYKKLKQHYSDVEIAERLAYNEDELGRVFEICGLDNVDMSETQVLEDDTPTLFKFTVRMSESEYEKFEKVLDMFKGDTPKDRFISMMAYYGG